ncbi:alpha-kinase family-domain-containing protein [Mycena floridula]|nr:alpha-kinase family-domain-containing protein [Mycena floridula]
MDGVAQNPARFPVKEELPKVVSEANLLYWAYPLHSMVYDFMEREKETTLKGAVPPFPLARRRLSFVQSGVAVAIEGTKLKMTYLVEEEIQGNFIKYLVNSSAKPLMDPSELGYDIACFLCFCQHVQYIKTGGLAYISDYQGAGDLLTDPQIMTSRQLAQSNEMLFGDGNVVEAFEQFPHQHVCKDWCQWFGLKPLVLKV